MKKLFFLITLLITAMGFSQEVAISINADYVLLQEEGKEPAKQLRTATYAKTLANGNLVVRVSGNDNPFGLSFDHKTNGIPYTDFRNNGSSFNSAVDVQNWFNSNTSGSEGGNTGNAPGDAANVSYDNSDGTLDADNVKDALDELNSDIAGVSAGSVDGFYNYYKGKYDKVVILGASIMELSFGPNGNTIQTEPTTIFENMGMDVDVYSYAVSGHEFDDCVAQINAAFTDHPDRTLFFFHIGGNNVSATRPYNSSKYAGFLTEMNKVLTAIEPRKEDVVFSSISFRSYGHPRTSTTLYDDPSLGSAPFNDNVLIPRLKEVMPHNINSDGRPIVDFYNDSYNNAEYWLDSSDGVHPQGYSTGYGKTWVMESIAKRLKYFVNGEKKPDPITLKSDDIIVQVGGETTNNTSGFNIVTLDMVNSSSISLRRANGETTSLSLSITSNGSTGANQIGTNTTGGIYGEDFFNRELTNQHIYVNSLYTTPSYYIEYRITGLAQFTNYKLGFAASRVTTEERVTKIDANGIVSYIRTSPSTPESPVYSVVKSDGAGAITIRQTIDVGTYGYLGGISLSDAPVTDAPQQLHIDSNNLTISNGNTVSLPSSSIETGTTAERPASPDDYVPFIDTTLKKMIMYDGTEWVDMLGISAD